MRVGRGENAEQARLLGTRDFDHLYIFSDLTQAEIVVPAAHVQECTDVSSGLENLGQYALHDMVTVDRTQAGVIIKVEHSSFKVPRGMRTCSTSYISIPNEKTSAFSLSAFLLSLLCVLLLM